MITGHLLLFKRRLAIYLYRLCATAFLCFLLTINLYSKHLPYEIQGNFQVSLRGAATYEVPILLPMGKGGFTPKLSILYNSQSGEGILGKYIHLLGISKISRVSKTYYKDGLNSVISWGDTDRFVLDGNYLVKFIGNEYRTETETFSRIVKEGSGENTSFRVYTKDGNTIFFDVKSKFAVDGVAKTLSWYPSRIVDALGNTITIHYGGMYQTIEELWVDKIVYGDNIIDFSYEPLTSHSDIFISGARIRRNKRLKSITVRVSGASISTYNFYYEAEKLVKISNTGLNSEKRDDKLFDWLSEGYHDFRNICSEASQAETYRFGDFNGDGKTDRVVISPNSWTIEISQDTCFYKWEPVFFAQEFCDFIPADVNNDGKLDFIISERRSRRNIFKHYVIVGENSYEQVYEDTYFQNRASDVDVEIRMKAGDFNGDGLTDYLVFHSGSGILKNDLEAGSLLGYRMSNGHNSFVNVRKKILGYSFSVPSDIPICKGAYLTEYIDFNGDGVTDIFYIKDNTSYVYTYSGKGLAWRDLTVGSGSWLPTKWHKVYVSDFNGDGLSDLLICGDDNRFRMFENIGNRWLPPNDIIPGFPHYDANKAISFSDFNGDGKDDIVFLTYNEAGKRVNFDYRFSTGNIDVWNSYSKSVTFDIMNWEDFYNIESHDYNGDGISDYYLGFRHIRHFLLSCVNRRGGIVSIKNWPTNRKKIFIEEKPLPHTPILPTNNHEGIINAVFPLRVVTKVKQTDETATSEVDYQYSKAKIRRGKGFLGFEKIVEHDLTNNLHTEQTYEIFPIGYYLMLKDVEIKHFNTLLSRTFNTNRVTVSWVSNLGIYYPYTETTLNIDEISGFTSSESRYNIDIYGNVGRYVKTAGGVTEDTRNTYIKPSGFGWCPSKLSVSNTTLQRLVPEDIKKITTHNSYTAEGLLQKSVSNGVVTEYTYTNYGALATSAVSGDRVTGKRQTSYDYDSRGLLVKQIAPAGETTEYAYDSYGRLIKTILPNGNTIENLAFDGFGNPTEIKSATGVITTIKRVPTDQHGACYIEEISTPLSGPTKKWIDSGGRVKKRTTPGFKGNLLISENRYNIRGLLEEMLLPHYQGETPKSVSYKYDYLGRLQEKDYNGIKTAYSYNKSTVTTITPERSVVTRHDASGKPVETNVNGQSVITAYNALGKPISVSTPWNSNISMAYDIYGNQTKLNDPSGGTTLYVSSALGEMLSQTDALNQTTTITYDVYGRPVQSLEKNYNLSTNYVTSGGGIGQVSRQVLNGTLVKNFIYDNYGRLSSEQLTCGQYSLSTKYRYDSFNRITRITPPPPFIDINRVYDQQSGMLKLITDANGIRIWEALAVDSDGKITKSKMGNNIVVEKQYSDKGFLRRLVTKRGNTVIQDFSYVFDEQKGNLQQRIDNRRYRLVETFTYDSHNRLTSSHQLRTGETTTYRYSHNGNIMSKGDVGTYVYSLPVNRYAVTSVVCTSYPRTENQTIKYTTFGQPHEIVEGDITALYSYSTDKTRWKMDIYDKGVLKLTWYYFGTYEQSKNHETGQTTHYNYVMSPEGPVSVTIKSDGSPAQTYYLLKDHLGSITAVVNSRGYIVEEYSYDAWGRERNVRNWTYEGIQERRLLNRGYTFHEQLPYFGLIHMNGRLYDPHLGRFLSPDNYVQAPQLPQNYNRYSYCLNNPLKYVDPSGEYVIVDDIIVGVVGGLINLGVNALQGNLSGNGFWGGVGRGFAAFGAGAVGGVGALYPEFGGWVWGGATVGATNAWLGGATSAKDIAIGAGVGGISGVVGGAAGQWAGQNLGGVIINGFNVASPVLKGAITGAISGAVGGYAGGFAGGLIMTGDVGVANKAGINGLWSGAAVGGVVGGGAGYRYAKNNNINPWTGVRNNSVTIGEGMYRVAPATKDLGNSDINKDWPADMDAYYDKPSRMTNPNAMEFNGQWVENQINNEVYIYDIGTPNGGPVTSPYYNMEVGRTMIYPNVVPVQYIHFQQSIRILIISR